MMRLSYVSGPVFGLALAFVVFIALLVVAGLSGNRYVRRKVRFAALLLAAHLAIALVLLTGVISPEYVNSLQSVRALLAAASLIIVLVTLSINSFRDDRVSERFPHIVQDFLIVGLFLVVATMLMQEKLLTTSAVGAVVIGFALQDTLGNAFAGLAIQIEKPFHVGHWISTGSFEGRVVEITWRATKINTRSGNFIVIPNNIISKEAITNYSEPTSPTRIHVDVGVGYDHPPNLVKATITDALRSEPLVMKAPEPEVLMWDFAASAITYRSYFWVADFSVEPRAADRVRSAIYYALRRKRLEIPYPIQVEYSRDTPSIERTPEQCRSLEEALGGVELLRTLEPDERAELAKRSPEWLFAEGEAIVREGDGGSSMFIIRSGTASVRVGPGGHEVAKLGPCNYFGEMSLLTGEPRTATVVATSDCEVIEIRHDDFRSVLVAHPSILEDIGKTVAERRAGLAAARQAVASSAAVETPRSLMSRIQRFFKLPFA